MESEPTLKPIADALPVCPCAQRDALRAAAALPDKPFRCGFDVRGILGIEHHIKNAVRFVALDNRNIGVLSTGERLAVALVLNRFDMLDTDSMLYAVERIGPDWLEAAQHVQRDGWA